MNPLICGRQLEVKGHCSFLSDVKKKKKMESDTSGILPSGHSRHPNTGSWSGLMVSRKFHKVMLSLSW